MLNHKVLHKAIQKIKHKFGEDKHEMRKAMYRIRDTIHEKIKTCADNVVVYIYVDDVLDEPLKFRVGSCENELTITVRDGGKIEYRWTSYTWVSVFWGIWEGIKDFLRNVFGSIKDDIPAILTGAMKAITLIDQCK